MRHAIRQLSNTEKLALRISPDRATWGRQTLLQYAQDADAIAGLMNFDAKSVRRYTDALPVLARAAFRKQDKIGGVSTDELEQRERNLRGAQDAKPREAAPGSASGKRSKRSERKSPYMPYCKKCARRHKRGEHVESAAAGPGSARSKSTRKKGRAAGAQGPAGRGGAGTDLAQAQPNPPVQPLPTAPQGRAVHALREGGAHDARVHYGRPRGRAGGGCAE